MRIACGVSILVLGICACALFGGERPSSEAVELTDEADFLVQGMQTAFAKIRDVHASGTYRTEYITSKTNEKQKEVIEWEFWASEHGVRQHRRVVDDTMLVGDLKGASKERCLSLYNSDLSWIDGRTTILRESGPVATLRRDAEVPDILPLAHDPREFSFALGGRNKRALGGYFEHADLKTGKVRFVMDVIRKDGATWTLEAKKYDLNGKLVSRSEYEVETEKGFVISRSRSYLGSSDECIEEIINEDIEMVALGIWLPKSTSVNISGNGRPFVFEVEYEQALVNTDITVDTLKLQLPVGVPVHDEVAGLKFTMPDVSLEELDLTKIPTEVMQEAEYSPGNEAVPETVAPVAGLGTDGEPVLGNSIKRPWKWIVIGALVLVGCFALYYGIVLPKRKHE